MLLPLKPICEAKRARRDGTSLIYIQYCFSDSKKPLLNTGIAIPPKYWNESKLVVRPDLPADFGDAHDLNDRVKKLYRLVEDLIILADRKKIADMADFVKKVFRPDLDFQALAEDDAKLHQLGHSHQRKVNTDFYFQLNDCIDVRRGWSANQPSAFSEILGSS